MIEYETPGIRKIGQRLSATMVALKDLIGGDAIMHCITAGCVVDILVNKAGRIKIRPVNDVIILTMPDPSGDERIRVYEQHETEGLRASTFIYSGNTRKTG